MNNKQTMTAPTNKGKAGRTNYAEWDRVATNLVEETTKEEEAEALQAKSALGLDGKYARSEAEAAEREKQSNLQKTKEKLDNFRERELALVHTVSGVLGEEDEESKRSTPITVRLTRDDLPEGKRVLVLTDTKGASIYDKIVLTQDLSQLTSQMPINAKAKSYEEDAENDASAPTATTIYGLIKVNLENLHHCTVVIESKIISGTVEIHKCSNLTIKFEDTATVATVQADLSEDISIEFYAAKMEPRIYHAGVSRMKVRLQTSGIRMETTADYLKDGAVAVGNATPEEYRFVTQLVQGRWLTEKVVQAGAKALTERELKEVEERRKATEEKVLGMAESMIQIKDKDGNPLVTKAPEKEKEEVVEEVVTDGVDHVVKDCEADKARGNEAFGSGEYGQAILHYSLALDKAAQLTSNDLFKKDIVHSNRAACFLKLGQHEKAEEDAAAALKVNPQNVKAQFRLGLALHALGRYQEAAPVLAAAQKIEPKNKQIKQALQFCEMRLQQEHRKRMEG